MQQELTGNFFLRVNSRLPQLTKQEKQAVKFIQNHRQEIIHLSITDLALQSKVSESTLTRLCVKLGYSGFQDMKINVAQEVVSTQAKIHENLMAEDSLERVMDMVFESSVNAINMTKSVLSVAEIERAVDALIGARRIVVMGSGNSGPIALDAHHKLLRIGLEAYSYTDTHMQLIAVSSLSEKDVVIGISHSGSSLNIKQGLELAQKRGATTISITSHGISPVSQTASIRLFTHAQEIKYRAYAISSRLAELAIIDTLYTGIALRKGDEAIRNFEQLEKALAVTKF